jgi:hypothetical protein
MSLPLTGAITWNGARNNVISTNRPLREVEHVTRSLTPQTGNGMPNGTRSHSASCVQQALSLLPYQLIYLNDSIASSSVVSNCASWTDEDIKTRSLYLQISETAQSLKRPGLDGSQFSVPFQTPAIDTRWRHWKCYRNSTYGNFNNGTRRIPGIVWARWLGGLRMEVNMA